MLHPILKNRSNLIAYSIIWLVIGTINTFIIFYYNDLKFSIAFQESLVFNVLYAVLGVGIWYPVYYTDIEKNNIANFLTNHLAAASLAVGVWLWLSYLIVSNLFADWEDYIVTLNASIPIRIGVGFIFYILIASNYYLMIYYQNFKDKLVGESELKALIKESELSSLKSQINPHFLFNSLNSISSLTMVSPEKAQDMVINLSDFLRYALSHKEEVLTTFEKELKNIDRYLKIENIRFGKRLHIDRDIRVDCNGFLLPGLILQPLMENAVKYGVYESTERSDITIKAICTNDLLDVRIINDYDPDFVSKKGEGIGLRNVSSRMRILYGREDLVIISREERRFEVQLLFPQNI